MICPKNDEIQTFDIIFLILFLLYKCIILNGFVHICINAQCEMFTWINVCARAAGSVVIFCQDVEISLPKMSTCCLINLCYDLNNSSGFVILLCSKQKKRKIKNMSKNYKNPKRNAHGKIKTNI